MNLNIEEIKKLIPHRKPFLFIEHCKIIERGKIGESFRVFYSNEYFFEGHFPGAPVMPGVLIVEAMAQVGGILALSKVPDPENYLTYFLKINNVKFKKQVNPGDTLIFDLTLDEPIRRGICAMTGKAFVNGALVTEAELMAQIVKTKNI